MLFHCHHQASFCCIRETSHRTLFHRLSLCAVVRQTWTFLFLFGLFSFMSRILCNNNSRFSFILYSIWIRPHSYNKLSLGMDLGKQFISVTAAFCILSNFLICILLISLHVSHKHRIFLISKDSVSFMLISRLFCVNPGSLVRNFISFIAPIAEFIRLFIRVSRFLYSILCLFRSICI